MIPWNGITNQLAAAAAVIFGIVYLANKAGHRTAAKVGQGMFVVPGGDRSGRSSETVASKVEVPPPPPGPGGTVKYYGRADENPSGIMGILAPLIKDPAKYMNEKDAKEVEKVLATLKEKFPAEAAAFSKYIDSIQARINQGKVHRAAGDAAASKKSYDRGESEMRKFMAQVSERDRAEAARRDLDETKRRVGAVVRRDRPKRPSFSRVRTRKTSRRFRSVSETR